MSFLDGNRHRSEMRCFVLEMCCHRLSARKIFMFIVFMTFAWFSVFLWIFTTFPNVTSSTFLQNNRTVRMFFKKRGWSKSLLRDFPVKNGGKRIVPNVWSTGNDGNNCEEKEVHLSSKRLPITGLVSFPGSGNTWTRHLIQQLSGLGTSSCYCDDMLRLNGFPFECYDQLFKAIVVKTHEFKHAQEYNFEKIVLLIRNPYDAILSYANYIKRRHTGTASASELKQVVRGIFNHSLEWYVGLVHQIVNDFFGPVHVVRFEKLKRDMSTTLWRLANFLNLTITQSDIACTISLQEGNFHRNISDNQHLLTLKEVYSKDMVVKLNEAIITIDRLLREAYGDDVAIGDEEETMFGRNISVWS